MKKYIAIILTALFLLTALAGTALAEGTGEKLTPLADFAGRALVLCRPGFSCSTPQLFQALDKRKIRIRPDVTGMRRAAE